MNDIISVDLSQVETAVVNRAFQVRETLLNIRNTVEDNFFDMCDLLLEAQENDYHAVWGFGRFADWVESSDLDMSARQAYYYINIAKKAQTLGLTREDLKKAKISKLKEIFALEPAEHAEEMRQLVEAAESATLDEVKDAVRKLRTDAGGEDVVYMTLKLESSVKELIKEAFEKARMEWGSDVSDTRCMETLCASYIQTPLEERKFLNAGTSM